MVEDLCNIGMSLKEECNLLVFTRLVGRYQTEDLPKEDRTLLNIQTQKNFPYNFPCCYDERKYISRHESTQNIVQTLSNFMINTLLKI